MPQQAIDYDALAQQHGGTAVVDYDALAAQHGGSAVPLPTTTDSRNALQKSFDANTGYNANDPLLKKVIAGAVHVIGQPFVHPIDTVTGAVQSMDMSNMLHQPTQPWSDTVKELPYDAGGVIGGIALGEGAGAIAKTVAPVVRQGASRVALLGKTPEAAYESALKPSTTLSQEERAQIIKTGLQNEIPVSKAGVEKLGDRIDDLNQAIKDEIAQDPTRPIDPNKVATRADIARAKFAKQVNAQPDLNAIEASRQQFLNEQGAKPGTPAIPPRPTGVLDAQGRPIMSAGTPAQPPTPAPAMNAIDAQEMKQGTYQVQKGKYGEQGSASVEAQKALARGLKEEIAIQFPEIDNLNTAESKLLDLQPVLERAVNRISNHQLIGIGTPVAGAAADAVAGPGVGRVAMVVKAVLDNPNVKSRLAIALSKGAKIPYAQAAARVAAYSSALQSSASGPPANSSDGNPNPPTTPQP